MKGILIKTEMKKYSSFSKYELRMGVFYGAIALGVFGILDPLLMPENYHIAWVIRYAIFIPLLTIFFGLTYFPFFLKISRLPSFILLLIGQLLVLTMIAISSESEPARHHYYIGLLIIMLWTGFVSRFGLKENVLLIIFTIIMLNVVYGFVHHSFAKENFPDQKTLILGTNIILIMSGAIIINGTLQIQKFKKELLKEIRRTENAKQIAERNDRLKSAFLANMSHEVRTPLNGMIGFSELLKETDLPQAKREFYLNFIRNGSIQLLRIIDDIIDISKLESDDVSISPSKFKVGKVLFEKIDYYQQNKELFTKKNIEIRMKIPPESINLTLNADLERFSKILDHLILNGIKYTDQGYLEIGISTLEQTAENFIQFYVSDTGIGIDEKNFTFIFERFNKVKDNRLSSGNGLGLSITKKLVELMGGKIWVKSEINKGSTFYFTLPYQLISNQSAPKSWLMNPQLPYR